MLELFHMTTDYFYKYQSKSYAPNTYVFYLYTNVLEIGTAIAHLCNMLTEIEDKYRFIPVRQSGFSDYHLIRGELLILHLDAIGPTVTAAEEE